VLDGKRVAVVVPAHDEEKLIAETIRSIPDFVDRVYVVDDRSQDGTVEVVRSLTDSRVKLIEHERNLGVGGAIDTNSITSPIVGFIFDQKGLMYNLTLEGSKITRINP